MSALEIILAVLLILSSVILTVVILMQESRQAGLSGAIAGGADAFDQMCFDKAVDIFMFFINDQFAGTDVITNTG